MIGHEPVDRSCVASMLISGTSTVEKHLIIVNALGVDGTPLCANFDVLPRYFLVLDLPPQILKLFLSFP